MKSKKIEWICKSCTGIMVLDVGVTKAACLLCGAHNISLGGQLHNSRTVYPGIALRRVKGIKVSNIDKVQYNITVRQRNKIKRQKNTGHTGHRKDKKMTDIMAGFASAAQTVQNIVDTMEKASTEALASMKKDQQELKKKNEEFEKANVGKITTLEKQIEALEKTIKEQKIVLAGYAKKTNLAITSHLGDHKKAGECFSEPKEEKAPKEK